VATPFHVIVDDALDTRPRGLTPYARGLLPALLAARPGGVDVVGFVSSTTQTEDEEIERLLPGLVRLQRSPLSHRQLAAAWQHGFTPPLGGMVHSPSLFAPLSRRGDQTVVSVHDAIAWAEPETLEGAASWYRGMAKRADRFADAVVVPSHAVAIALSAQSLFEGRMRVIPGAVTPGLVVGDDAADRRAALGVPERYIASAATLNPRKGLRELLTAIRDLDIPLVLTGPSTWRGATLDAAVTEAGLSESRVIELSSVEAGDLAAVLTGAVAFVEPSRLEGFGADVLDAMSVGTAAVVTDDPALMELVVDAARVVPREDLADGLRHALEDLLDDADSVRRLGVAGQDRARAFSWRDTAERIWQLHADV